MANEFSDDTLLARWLSGELSEEELQDLRDRPDFADYQKLAEQSSQLRVPAYDAAAELVRLQESQAALKAAAKSGSPSPKRSLRVIRYWPAAAAAVALLLTAWFFLRPPEAQEFYAEVGTPTTTINLHDGSVVKLNAGSGFTFVEGEKRLGKLDGEGFFEVEKSDVPFVVTTEYGTVTVLGTSFNVYARDGDFRVACTTGKVRVNFRGVEKPHELTPGFSVTRDGTGEVIESATDKDITLDWLNGRSTFKSTPLSEVIAELERQFDLEVKLPPGFDASVSASTGFTNTDPDEALNNVFGLIDGVNYRKDGRIIIVTEL